MLQPLVRRTWGPRGRTPLLWQSERHDRLSVMSALALSLRRCRATLYWHSQRHNIRAGEVVEFMREVRRHVRRGIVLILDRWSVHRARLVRRYCESLHGNMALEWLPAYAPELNPVEHVWDQSKYCELANFCPRGPDDLRFSVENSLHKQYSRRSLLRSFFAGAGLSL